VDPGIDNLVEAMRTVVQDKDKVEAFGKNFRAKILEQFTWEHQAKFILSQ
jgi:glycosyltransferase involved in cell wall biosynthesis